MTSRMCREPGVTVIWMFGCTTLSRRTEATVARSPKEEFTDEPTQTWTVGVPATSRTGTTLPGEEGFAISGSSAARSMTVVSS